MEDAIVIAAEVARGTGALSNEPVTTAILRDSTGLERTVRIVGGPTADGGLARLAGHVVPIAGARVPIDLRERPRRVASSRSETGFVDRFGSSLPFGPTSTSWIRNDPSGTWDASKLPVMFVLALPRSRDLGADAIGELEVAMRTWGRVACTSFRARFAEERAIVSGDDGINGVFFHDDVWPAELVPGAVGQTIVHVDATGKLRDADIHLNGVQFRFSNDGVAKSVADAPGAQDARSVLVHELGHALGLGHSNDPRATMSVSGSGLRWRSLEKDDVDGVCSLYPGIGSAGCDEDPCPSGFLCVAGACQRPGELADVCSPCTPGADACEAAGDDARCVAIGSGASAGRVCGRPCARDVDCAAGFACRPTTEAGDLQCVSLAGCKNGASLCSTNAECTQPSSVCREGVCVGRPDGVITDAGPSREDAGTDGGVALPVASGGGCDCQLSSAAVTRGRGGHGGELTKSAVRTPSSPAWSVIAWITAVLLVRRAGRR